jgi:hypothetical protein
VTSSRRFDDRLEDWLDRGLSAVARGAAMRRAKRLLHQKAYLRGRRCHCPAGMPRHLVHSEGLREGADVVVDFGSNVAAPGRRQVPVESLARIAPEIGNEIVHVKADRMGAFVQHVLPHIAAPFVLVTGDSDFAPVSAFESLLESDRIIHWFAQNCDRAEPHPKLTRLPIGIDNPHYTKLDKRLGFLATMLLGKTPFDPRVTRNDMGDQAMLQRIAAESRVPVSARPLRVLCTFHANQKIIPNYASVPGRAEARRQLLDNPSCSFVPRRLRQEEYWRIHEDFAFEVSPRGRGLDCFRTWECLVLGTIPIVLTSPLDRLFLDEGFPVVIVRSFAEINPANLGRWRDERAGLFTPAMQQKLTNEYWLARIRDAVSASRPPRQQDAGRSAVS